MNKRRSEKYFSTIFSDSGTTNGQNMRMANFQINAQIKDFSKMANSEFTKSTKFKSANGLYKFNFELTIIIPIWNRP